MKYDKQLQAKELRKLGKSIKSIAESLNSSTNSVRIWVQDIILTEEQINVLKSNTGAGAIQSGIIKHEKHINLRLEYQKEGRLKAQQKDLLHSMGCMLFWGEGDKDKNVISFTNSDVFMMKFFVKFLKETLQVDSKEISIRINCYLNNIIDIDNVHNYWINELDISGCEIHKPTIKITSNKIENNGICRILVYDTQKAQQLYGAIQEYAGFSNDMCLNNKRSRKIN